MVPLCMSNKEGILKWHVKLVNHLYMTQHVPLLTGHIKRKALAQQNLLTPHADY